MWILLRSLPYSQFGYKETFSLAMDQILSSCSTVCTLTFERPMFTCVNAHPSTPLEINFVYLGNMETYAFLGQAA